MMALIGASKCENNLGYYKKTGIVCILCTPRPMYRSTYRSSVGRYFGRHIGRHSAYMSTEISRSTYRPTYIGRVMVDISTYYRQISRSMHWPIRWILSIDFRRSIGRLSVVYSYFNLRCRIKASKLRDKTEWLYG